MASQSSMPKESPAETLASFVTATDFEDIPNQGRDTVIRAITDTIGVTLAGLEHDGGRIIGNVTGFDTDTFPTGRDSSGSRAELALLYGTAAHALDYDDLAWAMDGHPSVVLLPPILALTDSVQPSGRDVVTAYAVGFETACYVADPISPEHYEAGWHATSTFGAFGATAAAASLLNLDADATATALNIAASTPAGVKENFGSMTKPLHAGHAAHSGVTAALLAANGFTAGAHAIEGDRGFWSLYGDRADVSPPATPTSKGWKIVERGIHIKKYPACYFTHSSIAAVRDLVTEHDIDHSEINSIHVTASGGAGDALTNPEPETALESKFSMQHAVAVAVTADDVTLEWFEPDVLDHEALSELRKRVSFTVDTSLQYDSHEATVRIETTEGTFECTREDPPWTNDAPPSRAELNAKFVEAASRLVDTSVAAEVFDRLQVLPDHEFTETIGPLR